MQKRFFLFVSVLYFCCARGDELRQGVWENHRADAGPDTLLGRGGGGEDSWLFQRGWRILCCSSCSVNKRWREYSQPRLEGR